MTYIRGEAAQLDAWEDLGNPGWNWDALLPYYKKAENYTPPNAEQAAAGVTYDPQYHGSAGPVHVGHPHTLVNGPYARSIIDTWAGLSVPLAADVNSGHVRGLSVAPETVDAAQHVRCDAARAYYHPVEDRGNLTILLGTVERIVWSEGSTDRSLVARGVEVVAEDGAMSEIRARREVILAAGTVRTPLVLEASGVGNPAFVAFCPVSFQLLQPYRYPLPYLPKSIHQTSLTSPASSPPSA